jgi:DNA binding domain, excisionase family
MCGLYERPAGTAHEDDAMETRLLKVPDVAARLTLSRSKTYELIQTGELRAIRVGRARRVPELEVERFVARCMAEANREQPRPQVLRRGPTQCS